VDVTEGLRLPVLGVIGKARSRRGLLLQRTAVPALPAR
jgi:hypothetical protein